jgi:hypothetical protein
MKLNSKSGATLAAAAATLFLAGAVASTSSTPANAAMGKCMAGNACKGQSACKGGANSCKGLNACKGTGFSMASPKQCAAASPSRADRPELTQKGSASLPGPHCFDPAAKI